MITVFTSSYNHGEFLRQAMDSVLAQTYEDFEYLVYDDGSTDDTAEVMDGYDDPRIRRFYLKKQPNVGCVINHSLREMRGDVWVWAPADDVLLPNLLETKQRWLAPHDSVIYSDWRTMDGNEVWLPHLDPEDFREAMKTRCPIGMTGIWIPREVFDRVGPFPEHLPCSEDFQWVIRALLAGVEFHHVPAVLYEKRLHADTPSKHFIAAAYAKQIREELGFV